jgi:hypothetical protein
MSAISQFVGEDDRELGEAAASATSSMAAMRPSRS